MKLKELKKLKIKYDKYFKDGDFKRAKCILKKIKKESDNYAQQN